MFCPNCGTEISPGTNFCEQCGANVQNLSGASFKAQSNSHADRQPQHTAIRCPRCGSDHVQFATKTTSGRFSFFDSCCGFILMGPLGLLCGACGAGSSTEEFWICHNCGNKFSTGEAKASVRNAAKAEADYQTARTTLSNAGYETDEQIEADLQAKRQTVRELTQRYDEYLIWCVQSDDPELRRCAAVLQNDWRTGAWVLLVVSLLISGIGSAWWLALTLLSAGYLIVYHLLANNARTTLQLFLPDFGELLRELETAKSEEEKISRLYMVSQRAKKYERTHSKP